MPSEVIKILHFSDIHFTERPQFILEDYMKTVNLINTIPHDFSIFTGDLTQDGLVDEYVYANKMRKKIKSPKTYWIIGNHDSKNGGFEVWDKLIGPREFYEVDETNDILLIGLDSCIPDRDSGRFGREALNYTSKILQQHGEGKIKIVAFHHHLLPIPKTGRERSNAVDAGDMLSTLLEHRVDVILTGHKHHPNVYKIEDTIIINGGTTSSYKTRSGGQRTLNYIEIQPKKDVKIRTLNVEGALIESSLKTITRRFRMVNSAGGKWLRIVQLAGTDFGSTWNEQREIFNKSMELIKNLNADILVHCGNLTANGKSEEYDTAITAFTPYLKKYLFCPGPNDYKNYGEILANKYFNFDNRVEINNSFFYVLNTATAESDVGVVGRTALNKIAQDIYFTKQNVTEPFYTIAMHHHLLPMPTTKESSTLEDAGDVLRLIVDQQVNLVLTGHLGKAFCTRVEKTTFVNCNTLSSELKMSLDNSFNIIDISTEGGIVVSEMIVPSGFRRILGIFPGVKAINTTQKQETEDIDTKTTDIKGKSKET